jgi:hypothetical protein
MEPLNVNVWKVPIHKLSKQHLVVDLGEGGRRAFLDLATLLDDIRISIHDEDDIHFNTITSSNYNDEQFNAHGAVTNAVHEGKVFCNIPITNELPRGGGRRTKARRLSRRTRHTRRTRR